MRLNSPAIGNSPGTVTVGAVAERDSTAAGVLLAPQPMVEALTGISRFGLPLKLDGATSVYW